MEINIRSLMVKFAACVVAVPGKINMKMRNFVEGGKKVKVEEFLATL